MRTFTNLAAFKAKRWYFEAQFLKLIEKATSPVEKPVF
jgi:hypothetical protein